LVLRTIGTFAFAPSPEADAYTKAKEPISNNINDWLSQIINTFEIV
jgi:hypothetical protein